MHVRHFLFIFCVALVILFAKQPQTMLRFESHKWANEKKDQKKNQQNYFATIKNNTILFFALLLLLPLGNG